ncbi:hypothetical protein ILYODFUR_023431 [Ilyodon furcidens]|uniref:Uncharacterized protein n=1 Tax=Ilyodon furcidens TaxID=33524 RepID=A0ABV0U854_9TELE
MLLRPGRSELMHVVHVALAFSLFWTAWKKSKFNENWMSNQTFSAWLKPVQGNVYEAQEMFQTRHDGNQGSGVTHAQRETQSVKIKFITNSRYFPVLFHSRLCNASTTISNIDSDSSTTFPDSVRRNELDVQT